MEATFERKERELNIRINGRIDTLTSPKLREDILAKIKSDDLVTMDFAKVEFISSAGIRVVLETEKMVHKDGKLCITNVSEIVMDVFKAIKLERIIEMK